MVNISNNRATFSYDQIQTGKSSYSYSPTVRDEQGIEIDPSYEPSVIFEHLVDTSRWPKDRRAKGKNKSAQSIDGMDSAENNYRKTSQDNEKNQIGCKIGVYVYFRLNLYYFDSIAKARSKFPWVRSIFKRDSPHCNNQLRWALKAQDYDPDNLIIDRYKD